MNALRSASAIVFCACLVGGVLPGGAFGESLFTPGLLDWSVEILIDNDKTVFGNSQLQGPRDNRGLAISPDGRFLYAGYNNDPSQSDNVGEVRRIDLTTGLTAFDELGNVTPFDRQADGLRGKAIATDDQGRVYLAEGSRSGAVPEIVVLNSELDTGSPLFTIDGLTKPEGIALTRESGQLVMYTSDRDNDTLTKWNVTEDGAGISDIQPDPTFGAGGTLALGVGGSSDLRNVAIDGDGYVWVAGHGSDRLYRVSPDGTTIDMASVENPFDLDFNGEQVVLTTHTDRVVKLFNMADFESDSLDSATDVVPPWMELQLDEDGNFPDIPDPADMGALSGIVVIPGVGFFVTNESGQTAMQMSIYGGGDPNNDDNDPILFAALIPEPSAFVLGGLALLGFLFYAGRRRASSDVLRAPAER